MVGQGLLFGWIVPSQQSGAFPIIMVGGFRLRIEEIVILAGFTLLLFQFGLRALVSRKVRMHRSIRPIFVLLCLAAIGIVLSGVRGYFNQNPNALMDLRMLSVPTLFFIISLSALSVVSLPVLANVLYRLILPTALLLTVGSFLPVTEWLNGIYEPLGLNYGGVGNGLEAMLVFFLALTLAHFILQPSKRFRLLEQMLIVFIIVGFVVRISKPGWANSMAAVAILLPLSLAIRGYPGLGRLRKVAASRWMRFAFFTIALFLIGSITVWATVPETVNDHVDRALARILRPDAAGDITGGRLELMEQGTQLFLGAPILGYGMGSQIIPSFWANRQVIQNESELYVAEHFAPLWFLNRGGLILFAPIALLMLWHLYRGFRISRMMAYRPGGYLVVACYTHTAVVGFYAMFGIPQSLFETMILFWLSLAVVHNPAYVYGQTIHNTQELTQGSKWYRQPRLMTSRPGRSANSLNGVMSGGR
jgi:hypothetical protein